MSVRRGDRATDARVLRQIGDVYRGLLARRGSAQFERWRATFDTLHPNADRLRVDLPALASRFQLSHRAEALDVSVLLCAIESTITYWLLLTATSLGRPDGSTPPNPATVLGRLAGATFDARPGARLDLPPAASLIDQIPERTVDDLGWTWVKLMEQYQDEPLQDVASELHQWAVPRELRHGIGAYYTPAWLTDYVVGATVASRPLFETRIVDPTCGSGTFLVSACRLAVKHVQRGEIDAASALEWVIQSVYGFDIDPLAVLATEVNLLLAANRLAELGGSLPNELSFHVEQRDVVDPFPPELRGQFQAVVGNPPWVNWETLPSEYRERVAPLWVQLGIFDSTGRDLSFSKEDLSALVTYIAADRLLAAEGRLGFVLPQSLLKSSLNSRGFRRFQVGEGKTPLRVTEVDDLSAIRVFGGAASRPMVLFLEKGTATSFPVPYRNWSVNGRFTQASTWAETEPKLSMSDESAVPASAAPGAHWSTGARTSLDLLERFGGRFPYRARTGAFTGGANAVYYLRKIGAAPAEDIARMQNIVERAKRRVDEVVVDLECEFLYPLLRGREVSQWYTAPQDYVLCPHTADTRMAAVSPELMRQVAPLTYGYLEANKTALLERKGFTGWEKRYLEESFFATQRIGHYTFADYKVVWRYISPTFTTAVVATSEDPCGHRKPVIPHEKLIQIAVDDPEEAYFVCGVLSSAPAIAFVESRMVSTQVAPHVVNGLGMPEFSPSDERHVRISELCRKGHEIRAAEESAKVDDLFAEIDELVGEIFGVGASAALSLAAGLGRR